MEYSKVISITGMSGLFELMAQKTDGAIVRSLEDNTTRFVASRVHNFSQLEGIEVYTENENVNLAEVLKAMENASDQLPDLKDATAIKKYFEKVYPQMDFNRVYTSDLKKMVKWFTILKDTGVEIVIPETEAEPEENQTSENTPAE